MSIQPLVSVVMPVYNGATYLAAAIESILGQTYEHFEFIIIDDGSADGTWEILAAYAAKDKRIVLAQNIRNLGLVSTLNKGIAVAQGKYIARMDADDLALPQRFELQVAFLEDHPEVGVLSTAYYRIYENGEISLRRPPTSHTAIRWHLLFGNVLCHPSIMLRQKLTKREQPFYQDFRHAEDYELWCRLLKQTQAATLGTPLLRYRMHSSSVSSTYIQDQRRMVEMISLQQIETLIPSRFTPQELLELRNCYGSESIKQEQIAVCASMFELFQSFALQTDIDSTIVWQLRRYWSRQFWARVSVEEFSQTFSSGLFSTFVRYEPTAIMVGLAYLAKNTIRRLVRRIKVQPPEGVSV